MNEESKPCENTCGVMDILDPLSELFDVKETVTKDYHKPHPVDENILPKVEKNEELQNNKILFSDNAQCGPQKRPLSRTPQSERNLAQSFYYTLR